MGWAGQAAFAVVGGFLRGFLAGFLSAGWRTAGLAARPLGRPEEHPEGFGAAAGEPSAHSSRGTRGAPDRATVAAGSGPLPRQSGVGGDRAGQPQLGVGGHHQPGPAVGLGGMAGPWGGPAQGLLTEPDGVFQLEAADIGPPGQVQVGLAGPGPPQLQHLGWVGAGRDPLDLDAEDGAAHDRPGSPAAVAGVALLLGCSPAQACTVTVPYWSWMVASVAVGVGQVVGSAKLNLAPWRRGRPAGPCRRAGGSE